MGKSCHDERDGEEVCLCVCVDEWVVGVCHFPTPQAIERQGAFRVYRRKFGKREGNTRYISHMKDSNFCFVFKK